MNAFQVNGTSLERVELPAPEPGPGEVVVRVRAASLNYRDLAILRGTYGARPERPYIPLSDGAGEVAAVGPGVTRVKEGDRVVIAYVLDWVAGDPTEENSKRRLGYPVDGTLAEFIRVPQHALVVLPPEMPFEHAATMPIAGTTAWHALFEFGALQPGQTVVVQGTGGVSLFALQLAGAAGARVLLTTRGTAKVARAKALGADLVIDSIGPWDEAVRVATAGRGADLVLDVVGGPGLSRSLRAARLAGKVALIGFLDSATAAFDLTAAIQRRLDLRAVSVGPRASLEALVRAVSRHGIAPHIDRAFDFADAPQAFEAMASGAQMGKLVVRL